MPEFAESRDVVIIGSGPAGSSYARIITAAQPDAKVLLVEAGPVVALPPGIHMANIVDPDERERAQIASQGPNQYAYPLPATSGTAHNQSGVDRAKALVTRPGLYSVGCGPIDGDGFPAAQSSANAGGMGSHWFGSCPPPSPEERIPHIDTERLDEAYDAARDLLNVSSTQFEDSAFAAHVEKLLGDALNPGRTPERRVQPMPLAAELTPTGVLRSGPNVILGGLLEGSDPNFEFRTETICEKVLLEDGKVVGVRLRDRKSGEASDIGASFVVVAANSLHTPQVLFASGIRPAALGHYLNEHPQVSLMAEVYGLGRDEDHHGEVGNATAMSDSRAVAVFSSGTTWIPYDGDRFPFSAMLSQIDPDTVARSEEDTRERNPLITVHFFGTQELRYENRVEFSETETDWLGMPKMRIHHTLSERDLATLKSGKDEVLRIADILGKPVDGEEPWILPSGSSLHYQGTVRMGAEDDGLSVCDPYSRVWGHSNLYVAGNGVIPTETAGNPTLTSVALAVIAGRDIAAQLGEAREDAAA